MKAGIQAQCSAGSKHLAVARYAGTVPGVRTLACYRCSIVL